MSYMEFFIVFMRMHGFEPFSLLPDLFIPVVFRLQVFGIGVKILRFHEILLGGLPVLHDTGNWLH